MEKELRKMGGNSVHDEETIGLSIKDARHDLVNPFLLSVKNLQERIVNPELKPLGEKKVRFRDWHSRSEVAFTDATVEGEQTEESGKVIEEGALVASFMEEPVNAGLGRKEVAAGEVEGFTESFEECGNKVDSLVEEPEENAEGLEEPEEIIEDVLALQEKIIGSIEELEETSEELETTEEMAGQAEELLKTVEEPEKTEDSVEAVGEEPEEEQQEEKPEPEESDSFSQVQVINRWMEEPVEETIISQKLFDDVETLFPEEAEEVLTTEAPEKADTALVIEEPEAVWQQWEDERDVPAEDIDGNAESQMDSGKAVMAAEQSDEPVRRNKIITSSVSKGFGQGRQEEERPVVKTGISFINKRRR